MINNRKWIWIGLALAICAVGGYFILQHQVKPLYRQWRTDKLTLMARTFLADKDAPNAILTARKILEKDRANVDAWRIGVAASKLRNSPDAVAYQSNLCAVEKTTENYLELMRLANEFRLFSYALEAINAVASQAKGNLEFHRLASSTYKALGKSTAAKYHLLSIIELSPGEKSARLDLAEIEIEEDFERTKKDLRPTLRTLAEDPIYKTRALSVLLKDAIRAQSKIDAEELTPKLLASGELDTATQILALNALSFYSAQKEQAMLQQLKVKCSNDVKDVTLLLAYFGQKGLTQEATKWYMALSDSIKSEEAVQRNYAEILLKVRQWSDLDIFLRPLKWKEREYLRNAYLAIAYRNQGMTREFQDAWKLSVITAKLDIRRTYDLLLKADGWRWETERFDVLWNLFSLAPDNESVRQQLITWERQNSNTANLNKIYARIVEIDGSNSVAKNNFAYSSLLLNSNYLRAQSIAHDLFIGDPKNPFFVTTYAFSLYKAGKSDEALSHLRSLGASALSEPERMLLHAAFLAGTGDAIKATDLLNDLPESRLLPEEKQLAQNVRKEIIRLERIQGKRSQLFALQTQQSEIRSNSGWIAILDDGAIPEQTVSMQLADNYYTAGNMIALKDTLRDGSWTEFEHIRLALLSFVYRSEDEILQSKNTWSNSLAQAGRDKLRLQALLRFASKWEWNTERIEVLRRRFELDPSDSASFTELFEHYKIEGRTPELVKLLGLRYTALPADIEIATRLAYYSLLTNVNTSQAYVLAKSALEKDPNSSSKIFVQSYALWHQKRYNEAAKLVEISPAGSYPNSFEASSLIKAAIYVEINKKPEARSLLDSIDPSHYSPEEKRLLNVTKQKIAQE